MNINEEISRLREQGLPPKVIARQLGLRPAAVSEAIRALAAARDAGPVTLPELVGCLISPGWGAGLGLGGQARQWDEEDGHDGMGTRGLVTVVVARAHRYGNVVACVYLVDTYCLGVKRANHRTVTPDELRTFTQYCFRQYDSPPLKAPIELAQSIVLGAVEYARSLGFPPPADFEACRRHLGADTPPVAIQFGEAGRPHFINGPRDDVADVLATLRRSVGEGNFHFTLGGPG